MGNFENSAEKLLDNNDYDELLKLAENEIKNNPNNEFGYYYKIVVLDHHAWAYSENDTQEPYKEVNKWCDIFYEKFPNLLSMYLNDVCWMKLGAIRELYGEEARTKYCDELIEKYPTNPDVYTLKAGFADIPHEQAISLYKKPLKLQTIRHYTICCLHKHI